MQAIKDGGIAAAHSPARRSLAVVMAVLVVAVLLSALVVWRVTGTEQSRGGAVTRDAGSTIEVHPPIIGARRSMPLPERGEVEFPMVGPHPPDKQPKDG